MTTVLIDSILVIQSIYKESAEKFSSQNMYSDIRSDIEK